jgi:hypothetical protein
MLADHPVGVVLPTILEYSALHPSPIFLAKMPDELHLRMSRLIMPDKPSYETQDQNGWRGVSRRGPGRRGARQANAAGGESGRDGQEGSKQGNQPETSWPETSHTVTPAPFG